MAPAEGARADVIALLALAGVAAAADTFVAVLPPIDAQSLRPSLDSAGLLLTDDTRVGPSGATVRALLSYTNDPLSYTYADGQRYDLVSDVLQLDLMPSVRFWRARVGVDLPLIGLAVTEGSMRAGWGDARFDARVVALDGEAAPLGVAVAGSVSLPTGVVNGLRASALTYDARLVLDRAFGPHRVALNVGARALPTVDLDGLLLGDAATARLGYALALDGWLPVQAGVGAELWGQQPITARLDAPGALQLEGMLSGYVRRGGVVLRAGAGAGLTHGVGVADARVVFGLGYERPDGPADRDHDGVPNRRDACPRDPEDLDGVQDDDGCGELAGPIGKEAG